MSLTKKVVDSLNSLKINLILLMLCNSEIVYASMTFKWDCPPDPERLETNAVFETAYQKQEASVVRVVMVVQYHPLATTNRPAIPAGRGGSVVVVSQSLGQNLY